MIDEFYANYYLVKHKDIKKVIFRGALKDGMYQVDLIKLGRASAIQITKEKYYVDQFSCNVVTSENKTPFVYKDSSN